MKLYRGKKPIRYRLHEGYDVGDNGCWIWKFYTYDGYGFISTGGSGQMARAHIYYYEALVGPIPDGKILDHLCRVRACVNPEHLEPVTFKENVLRGIGPTAVNARKTHCIHGHELTEDNIYRHGPNKNRHCRECALRQAREQKARARARKVGAQS